MPNKRQIFKYFADPEMTKPLYVFSFGEELEDLPVAGQRNEFTVYALNVTNAEFYEIEFIPTDPDLKIVTNTQKCKPNQLIMIQIVFTPPEDRQTPLDASFTIKAKGVIRHKR